MPWPGEQGTPDEVQKEIDRLYTLADLRAVVSYAVKDLSEAHKAAELLYEAGYRREK